MRFARWDLSSVDLVDPRSGVHLCTLLPIDKHKNAERQRRGLLPPQAPETDDDGAGAGAADTDAADDGIAPLLRKYMRDHAATGLPPAYLPLPSRHRPESDPTKTNDSPLNQENDTHE